MERVRSGDVSLHDNDGSSYASFEYQAALQDFRRARRQASLEQIGSFLTGQSNELLSYEDVRKKLKVTGMSASRVETIPLDAIVGSVGRYKDFTRSFLPRNDSDQKRWAEVQSIATGMEGLPPIEVYQIGDVYFVLDGNHRVSVARQLGASSIEAYVTKIKTKVPISPDIQPDELTLKAEYAAFLAKTHLDVLRPHIDMSMSMAGRYRLLEEQIEEHRYFMAVAQKREIPYNEAVLNWYDTIYHPVTTLIRQYNILKDFPKRTETDLYLWISEYRAAIREGDVQYFEEHMTEILDKLPLVPDIELDKLILDVEYVDFLEQTQIEKLRPNADLRVTAPGKYNHLLKHIEVHRHFLGEKRQQEVSYEEAVTHWYDTVYLPIAAIIRRQGMLRDFRGRTEADLYLWIVQHRYDLEQNLGWKILPEKAAEDLVTNFSDTTERVISRIGEKVLVALTPDELEAGPPPGVWRKEDLGRLNDRLFGSFLVPVSGKEDEWSALEQALVTIGSGEKQYVYGLHVLPAGTSKTDGAAQAVLEEFNRRCQEAGVEGALTIQTGEIAKTVCTFARWADLVVLNLAHPPGKFPLKRMQSGFRMIIRRCSRPVLAVPKAYKARPFQRIFLAYDGSQKADEALFISAFMGAKWYLPLVVMTAEETDNPGSGTIQRAEEYLKRRNVKTTFIHEETGKVSDAILATVKAYECHLILMGGYGRSPMLEMVLGSTVDQVLRKSQVPVLICR
ncbi:hypothetical protein CSA56_16920 [candidate division KSB3 bacterium]|uniref:UspA domain-containing protein n=1 Tax=candidate division KSB3 bacterium TaxID=2044937 RepID=A0A2G6K990_9BACT|nr:MAG: hypothetical protein CSA56_16920 [candidate division KSB3 bacterium]